MRTGAERYSFFRLGKVKARNWRDAVYVTNVMYRSSKCSTSKRQARKRFKMIIALWCNTESKHFRKSVGSSSLMSGAASCMPGKVNIPEQSTFSTNQVP
jgi:hypothetical protein